MGSGEHSKQRSLKVYLRPPDSTATVSITHLAHSPTSPASSCVTVNCFTITACISPFSKIFRNSPEGRGVQDEFG